MIEPFKYLLQPVALERNGTGRVVREVPGETLSVYSADEAADAIRKFEQALQEVTHAERREESHEDQL